MRKKRRKGLMGALCICILAATVFFMPDQKLMAGVFDDAQSFYNQYGNNAVFSATSSTDGYIYFGSSAKTSTSGTKYRTIGWKMSIQYRNGSQIQTVYYQLGGSYLVRKNQKIVSGTDYSLYAISLGTMKSRLNATAKSAINSGNCQIILDACMAVVKNGKVKGSMNDYGTVSGTVYTTYSGIAGAAGWSNSALNSLYSYFGKSVSGLFYNVSVKKGTGIASVYGGGNYCYGTWVTVGASCQSGYSFKNWNGSTGAGKSTYGFYVTGNSVFTAYANPISITVNFMRNSWPGDELSQKQSYTYKVSNQTFPKVKWQKNGYHMIGWCSSADGIKADYPLACAVADWWIADSRQPRTLYGLWQENTYHIVFDTGESIDARYGDTIDLPEKSHCLGWSLLTEEARNDREDFLQGEECQVSLLSQEAGVENIDGATIYLFAVWNYYPTIEAADIYCPVEDAHNGKIDEGYLGNFMRAYDHTDGDISYGLHENNSFLVDNIWELDFKAVKDGDIYILKLKAVNSLGNVSEKEIKVYFVDTSVISRNNEKVNIRFISKKYLQDNSGIFKSPAHGGLMEDSCWKQGDYFSLLMSVLD